MGILKPLPTPAENKDSNVCDALDNSSDAPNESVPYTDGPVARLLRLACPRSPRTIISYANTSYRCLQVGLLWLPTSARQQVIRGIRRREQCVFPATKTEGTHLIFVLHEPFPRRPGASDLFSNLLWRYQLYGVVIILANRAANMADRSRSQSAMSTLDHSR